MGKKVDLTGQRFGRWTVLEERHVADRRALHWLCRCDCGTERLVHGGNLRSGISKSCGCLNRERARAMGNKNAIDIAGERFGRLVALSVDHPGAGGRYWLCRCDCGKSTVVLCADLRSGGTKSCGCLAFEMKPPVIIMHGMSRTKLYKIWVAMRQRCGNPNDPNYDRYGGRGIEVCEEWSRFEAFMEWAISSGYVEGEVDLDREDNDKGYSPENCRFITHRDNLRNTHRKLHDVINGEDVTLSEAAEKYGVPYRLIYQRYKRGKRGGELIEPAGNQLRSDHGR